MTTQGDPSPAAGPATNPSGRAARSARPRPAGGAAHRKRKPAAQQQTGARSATAKTARQGATPRTDKKLAARLKNAELVLVNGLTTAVALQYAPGTTPVVLARGTARDAEAIVWCAQNLDIPLIEQPSLEPRDVADFEIDAEIPESHYRTVAHALAMLYKAAPSPAPVRFLRLVNSADRARASRLRRLEQDFGSILEMPALAVDLGEGLAACQEDFEKPMLAMRQRIATEMGLLLEPIPMRADPRLEPGVFSIRLRDVPVQDGAIDLPLDASEKLYVLVNRVKQVLYRHGWELLTYREVDVRLDWVRAHHARLFRALFPANLSVPALRQILRNLLREQLSIRDLPTILEVIQDNLGQTQDPDLLTECVRMAYSRSLCHKYQAADGFLNVLVLDPDVERQTTSALKESAGVRWLDLTPEDGLRTLRALEVALKKAAALQFAPVLLTSPLLRRFVSRLVEPIFSDLAVMSYNEIAPLTQVRSIGQVSFL